MKPVSHSAALLALIILLLVLSACRLPFGLGRPADTPTATTDPSTPTQSRLPTWTSIARSPTPARPTSTHPYPSDTATPAVLESPTETLTPRPSETYPAQILSPTPSALGMGRSNPFPRSALVPAPNWDVQVLEYRRGDAAWRILQDANPLNEEPGADQEYVMARLRVKCTYPDQDMHAIMAFDFELTGSRLQVYEAMLVDAPGDELYAELTSGQQTEGWAVYLAGKEEKNLMLVVNEMANFDEDRYRYIALDDGAAIFVDPQLAAIRPTDLGVEADRPARFSDRLVTRNWEVSMLELLRGEAAMERLRQVWLDNPVPADGMQYLLLRVQARYIGTADRPERIDSFYFSTLDNEGFISDYGNAVPPEPILDVGLYPGGTAEGWVLLQVRSVARGLVLVFQPLVDDSTENQRFVRLE